MRNEQRRRMKQGSPRFLQEPRDIDRGEWEPVPWRENPLLLLAAVVCGIALAVGFWLVRGC